MANDEGISKPPLSPARLAANRRNAQKSTGPKTKAGKRRVALNARRFGFSPPEIEQQLRARGEDPRDFRRLHRDVAALFPPQDGTGELAVQLLAMTWWEKARRIRNWVGAGLAPTRDLDGKIEELLVNVVDLERERHGRWRARLVEVLGQGLEGPGDARRKIERRLFAFGATKTARRYPRPTKRDRLLDKFEASIDDLLAGSAGPGQNSATSREPAPNRPEVVPEPALNCGQEPGKGLEGQNKAKAEPQGLSSLLSEFYARIEKNKATAIN
ncbi:MAG: hypothetical protein ACLQOO_02860 [Terriglobia bacterium]